MIHLATARGSDTIEFPARGARDSIEPGWSEAKPQDHVRNDLPSPRSGPFESQTIRPHRIAGQKEHHEKISFRDEFIELNMTSDLFDGAAVARLAGWFRLFGWVLEFARCARFTPGFMLT